jgi:hypothetical protein
MPAQSNDYMSPCTPSLGGDAFRELEIRGDCLIQKNPPTSANQPLYYVATGEFSVDWDKSLKNDTKREKKKPHCPRFSR